MPSVSRRAVTALVSALVATATAATAASLTVSLHPASTVSTAAPAAGTRSLVATATMTSAPAEQAGARLPAAVAHTEVRPTADTTLPVPRSRTTPPAPSGYAFLFPETSSGPVRWNPCTPIHYVTNVSAAPQLRADLAEAVARLSAVTGITFVDDGDTREHSSSHRALVDSTRGTWAPVLVDVAGPGQSDLLRDGDDGEGVATWWRSSRAGTQIVTGQLVLRAGSVPTRLGGFTDPDAAGPFLLHELGHVLGLGHVQSSGEIMNHDGALRARDLGPGDLAGLRRLGAAAGCLSEMPVPPVSADSVPLNLVH